MNNLSFAILDGNLVQDPEIRELGNDKKVATFTLATNHEWRSKDQNGKQFVSYFTVEAWDRQADPIAAYLKKGSRVTVEGNLRQDRWNDQDGNSRSKVKVIARSVRFDWIKKGQDPEQAGSKAA